MKFQKNWKKYGIIGIVIITFLLGVTAYSISVNRKLSWIEKGVKDTVLVVGNIFATPVRFLQDKLSFFSKYDQLVEEHEQLERDYQSEEQNRATIEELTKENEELKKLLEMDASLSQYQVVHASVIGRDATYWLSSFTINKGEKDGLQVDMAVMGNGGVIGYISQTSAHTSTVKLLTSPHLENQVSVKIELTKGKYAYGLLTGYDAKTQTYKIEGISDYVDIPISAKVTTTGLSDRFPSGLFIGTVQDVSTDSFDLAKEVSVKPSASTGDLSFVTVLVREVDAS